MNVLTWKLAVLTNNFGPQATGDIVRRLGAHIGTIAEGNHAQEEAWREKDEGRMPH